MSFERRVEGLGSAVPHAHVVAAAIERAGAYLLGRRPAGSNIAGRWEFPGGKVRRGETPEAALARELSEELAIEVEVGPRLHSLEHAYPHLNITLELFACRIVAGEPRALYHEEIGWFTPQALEHMPVAPSNHPFLEVLRGADPL
jgi:mutator protein MutT